MNRKKDVFTGFFLALFIFIGVPLLAKAAEENGAAVKSAGSIVYESGKRTVQLYAEDIMLLQEKLGSVPDTIFDPGIYVYSVNK